MSTGAPTRARAVVSSTEQLLLGEGARWDARRRELLHVDILAGRVLRHRVAADGSLEHVRSYRLDSTVGAVAPIELGAPGNDTEPPLDPGWILAAGRGFVHLAPDGSTRIIAANVAVPGTRMNDAACDPWGRFWAGTMAGDQHPGGGSLFRLGRDGRIDRMLDGLTISNGLGWSPDGQTMYLVDSGHQAVHSFEYDGAAGTLAARRRLITLADGVGSPDGLTVDADGHLWVAIYDGGQVRRYSPSGELLQVLEFPTAQTTSAAFAGEGLHRLYVTTATEGWSERQRRADPSGGVVYRVDTGSTGRPAEPFRPDPRWFLPLREE